MKTIKIAVLVAALVGTVSSARAAVMSPAASAVASAAAEFASEIEKAVGRVHDGRIASRVAGGIVIHDGVAWRPDVRMESLTVKGEACLLYMDLLAEAIDGAMRLRGRETLYEQAKTLIGDETPEGLTTLEVELEYARREQARLAAREQALRAMLIGSRWAHLGPDGLLHLGFEFGKDYQAAPDGPGHW